MCLCGAVRSLLFKSCWHLGHGCPRSICGLENTVVDSVGARAFNHTLSQCKCKPPAPQTHKHTHIRTHIHTHMRAQARTLKNTNTHFRTCVCTHALTYTHTHTHTHTHTCSGMGRYPPGCACLSDHHRNAPHLLHRLWPDHGAAGCGGAVGCGLFVGKLPGVDGYVCWLFVCSSVSV